jgi:hypothetical protein
MASDRPWSDRRSRTNALLLRLSRLCTSSALVRSPQEGSGLALSARTVKQAVKISLRLVIYLLKPPVGHLSLSERERIDLGALNEHGVVTAIEQHLLTHSSNRICRTIATLIQKRCTVKDVQG